MTTEPLKNQQNFVLELNALNKQVKNSELPNEGIIKDLEQLIQNWQNINLEDLDKNSYDDIRKLSNRISKRINMKKEKALAEKLKNFIDKLIPVSSAPSDFLDQLCPGYEENPSEALAKLTWEQMENLIKNFDKLRFEKESDRLALCKEIAVQGGAGAEDLAKNIDKFGLEGVEVSDRLDLYKQIVAQNEKAAVALVENFDKLRLEKVSDRLALCKEIAAQGWKAVGALAKNIDKLGLKEVSDRFDLCKEIAVLGEMSTAALTKYIDKFGLEGVDESDRLHLYKQIAAQDGYAAKGLAIYIDKYGLKRVSDRFDLCKEIAAQSESAAIALVQNIDKFRLEKVEMSDRLDLYKQIAAQGWKAVEALAINIDKLGLKRVSDRIDLCKEIAALGKMSTATLAKYIDKFELEGVDVLDLLELYKQIVAQGEKAAVALVEKFDKLGLERAKLQDRLDLYKQIVAQGEKAAVALVENFDKLGLERAKLQDRLDLCKQIAAQGGSAVIALAKNIDKFRLEKVEMSNRLHLYKQIVAGGAAEYLIEKFDKLGLERVEVSDRFTLCKEIAAQGGSAAIALANNIDKFGLKEVDVLDRLDLYKQIVAQGKKAAVALVENFEKLGLEGVEGSYLLDLYKQIVAQGGSAAIALARNIDKLGLKGVEVFDRLDLYKEIAAQGGLAVEALAINIDKLGLERVSDRFALCKEIAVLGKMSTAALVINIDKFGLKEVDVSDRLDLYKMIVEKNQYAAKLLAENFDKLELEGAKLLDRLDLCKQIVARGEEAAVALVENFDKLGLEEAILSDRFALCREIAAQGKEAARTLARYIDKFRLEGGDVSDLLDLYKQIVAQGEKAADYLIKKFDKLGLKGTSDRLALCKHIVGQCEVNNILTLVKNFDKLGLEEAKFSDRLALCKEIAARSWHAVEALVNNFDKFGTESEKRQILFELLQIPHYLDDLSRCKNLGFASKVIPSISLLLKKGGDSINAFEVNEFEKFLNDNKLSPLRSIFQKIKQQKDEWVRLQLSQWAAYSAGVLYDLSEDQIETISKSGILEDIYYTSNRFTFVRQLSLMMSNSLKEMSDNLKKMQDELTKKKWTKLSCLLLFRMKDVGFSKSVEAILTQISRIRGFRDAKRFDHLVQLLLKIIEGDPYPYEEEEIAMIGNEISKVLARKKPKKMKKGEAPSKKVIEMISNDLQLLTNIFILFGKKELISCLKSKKNLQSFFQEKFQTLFEVEDLQDLGTRYNETFGAFRDKIALFTYLCSVNKLPSKKREAVKKALNAYVNAVLNGTFPDIRYETNNNSHLKTLFANRGDLKGIWTSNYKDYKEYFFQKFLKDNNLDSNEFPHLRDYLQGKRKKLKKAEMLKLDEPKAKFQILAIDLCEGKIDVEDFVKKVKELKLDIGEFEDDLLALIPKKSFLKYEISESDDPCDLLLIGTEIQGSCLRIDGSHRYNNNKCLVSCLMNGEIRPIVVKRRGKLVARSLLRLMWDEKNQTPVLLLEKCYSNVSDKAVLEAIKEWALKKAKNMRIPLVSKEIGEGKLYPGTVEFLGGFAPFVYSDAADTRGKALEGAFETKGCHILYMP